MFLKIISILFIWFCILQESYGFIGGIVPASGKFPTLKIKNNCTTVAITTKHLLLAGHCITSPKPYVFIDDFKPSGAITILFDVLWDYDRGISYGMEEKFYRKVIKVYLHPNSKFPNFYNTSQMQDTSMADLAIVELDKPLPQKLVAPIDFEPLTNESEVFVGGYGCDVLNPDENHPVVSEALRVAKKRNLEMSDKMVLVRTKDANGITSSNACNGDSGGPVYKFEEKNETFKIVGVNSARLALLWFDIGFYFTRLDRHSTIHPSPQNWISDVIADNISPEILP